jgi:antitoxin component YwqK of YwqJK toxin-antitoxin module
MKNGIVLFLVLILANFVFGQGENKTDVNGLKQGEWKKFHENGMLSKVGIFKDDHPVGEWLYYYDSGKMMVKITHKGAESHSISFHKSGGPQSIGKFVNQKKDSTWVYYDLDGYKIASDFFINGEKNRISYVYYQSGKIAEEKEYKAGFEQGAYHMFWKDGKKKKTATYENGALEGKVVFYNSAGFRSISGFYYHDLRNSIWLYFEEDGNTIKKKEEFHNGIRIDAGKDDLIETEPQKPINEDFLNPENFGRPR